MGFLAPAMPWIARGASIVGGLLAGRKAQSSAQQRSPEEQAALSGAQGIAGPLGQQGLSLFGQGAPMLGQAGNYWSTLLAGNRAQMAQATAGPRAALTDVYRGAEANLDRSGIRGAQRDVASAELGRDRAGQIARLTTGMQPAAASQLGDLAGTAFAGGTGASLGSAQIWRALLGEGFANRVYAREEGEKASKSIGSLIFDILSKIPVGAKPTPLENKAPPSVITLPPSVTPTPPRY